MKCALVVTPQALHRRFLFQEKTHKKTKPWINFPLNVSPAPQGSRTPGALLTSESFVARQPGVAARSPPLADETLRSRRRSNPRLAEREPEHSSEGSCGRERERASERVATPCKAAWAGWTGRGEGMGEAGGGRGVALSEESFQGIHQAERAETTLQVCRYIIWPLRAKEAQQKAPGGAPSARAHRGRRRVTEVQFGN